MGGGRGIGGFGAPVRWRVGLANLGQQALIVGLRGAVEVFLGQWSLSVKSATRKTRQSRSWTQTGRGSEWQPMKMQRQGFGVRVAKMQHVPQARDHGRVARISDMARHAACLQLTFGWTGLVREVV